jgi:GNAT superfamily N-acetyltransferase
MSAPRPRGGDNSGACWTEPSGTSDEGSTRPRRAGAKAGGTERAEGARRGRAGRLVTPRVRRLPMTDPAAEPLLRGLREEYDARYGGGATEMSAYDFADFEPPAGCFLILTLAGRTVAGGGFRRLDESTAEVKRMWTDPAYRRRGLARRVLGLLESEAAGRGYLRLRLETGQAQPEAVALYAAAGWVRSAEGYGRHRDSPRAVFFEKRLLRPP